MIADPFLHYLESKYIQKLAEIGSLKREGDVIELICIYLVSYEQSCIDDFCKKFLGDKYTYDDGGDIARSISNLSGQKSQAINELIRVFRSNVKNVAANQLKKMKGAKQLSKLCELFELSELESSLIEFLYVRDYSPVFDDMHFTLVSDTKPKSTKILSRLLGCTPRDLSSILSRRGTLRKACILGTSRTGDIELDEYIMSYLSGMEDLAVSDEYLQKSKLHKTFKTEEFSLNNRDLNSIRLLFSSQKAGAKVLLYGAPGTGKTEFSKAIAKELGRELYIIRSGDADGDESLSHRQRAIVVAQNTFANSRPIILVDESDSIINTQMTMFDCERGSESDSKAWINDILEDNSVDMIWISNRISGVDESTKRRFSYAIEFTNLNATQREKIWHGSQKQYNKLFTAPEISSLASTHKVNAGSVGIAFKSAKNLSRDVARQDKRELVKSIVYNHEQFIGTEGRGRADLTSYYNPEIINTDTPVEKVLHTVGQYYEFMDNHWASDPPIRNINILLQGPSGTGKTEFAKYLAKVTGKKLIQKTGSDIFDKYVGETEKNIAEVFRAAENEDAILLLDEADSLFISREDAERSWQVSQTNELLVQMENYKGVLICSTNFVDNLDVASLRRFNIKVHFSCMSDCAKVALFNTMLSELSRERLTSELERELTTIGDLTVGDFKTVFQRNFFSSDISNKDLVSELKLESRYRAGRNSKIGF